MPLEVPIADYKAQVFGTQASTQTPQDVEPTPVASEETVVTPAETTTQVEPAAETPTEVAAEVETPAEVQTEEIVPPDTPQKEELKFANETSEKLYKAILDGKEDEVFEVLATKKELANAENLSATEAIKLHLKYTNKEYNSQDIVDIFEDKYYIPKEPVQKSLEDDDDFAERHDEWKVAAEKVARRIERDAKMAKAELAKMSKELVLPNIDSAKDEGYEKWLQEQQVVAQMTEQEKQAYLKFTPKDVALEFKFTDEANKLNIDFQFTPDKEGFSKAVNDVSDLKNFFANFYAEDGSPQRDRFLKGVYVMQNIDKILTEAVKQATNETRRQMLANQKNIGGDIQKTYVSLPATEVDKLKQAVFGAG